MYRQVFQSKNFMKMTLANMISSFGDSVDTIAFTWLTYALSQSAAMSALVCGLNLLPTALLQPIVSPIAERCKKKPVMVCTDLIRGGMVALTLLLYLQNVLQPWMMLILTFLMNTVEALRTPCGTAFAVQLLEEKEYETSFSFSKMGCSVAQLAGMALGGVLVTLWMPGAFLIDLITFLVSAFLIKAIHHEEASANQTGFTHKKATANRTGFAHKRATANRTGFAHKKATANRTGFAHKRATADLDDTPYQETHDNQAAASAHSFYDSLSAYFHLLSDGFLYLMKNRLFLLLVTAAILFNAVSAVISALMAPYAAEVFGGSGEVLSIITTMDTAGMLLGFFFYPKFSRRIDYRTQLVLGYLSTTIFTVLLLIIPKFAPAGNSIAIAGVSFSIDIRYLLLALCSFVYGIMVGILSNLFNILFVKLVDQDYMARATGIFNSSVTLASPVISFVIAGLVKFLSVAWIYLTAAVLSAAIGLWFRRWEAAELLKNEWLKGRNENDKTDGTESVRGGS